MPWVLFNRAAEFLFRITFRDVNSFLSGNINKVITMPRSLPYRPSYWLQFGLRVVSRTPTTGKVNAVICRFRKTFGRKPVEDGRITKTNRNRKDHMVFKTKFRTDVFVQHHRLMHNHYWRKYKELPDFKKENYFSVDNPFDKTIPYFFLGITKLRLRSIQK